MKILILEDEPAAARRLRNMLLRLKSESQIVAQLESIAEGREWFDENEAPDLILSDIRLADGISFTLLNELKVEVPIIFITAYDEYALEAFHMFSVDYLLKPIKEEDLNRAIEKYLSMNMFAGIDYDKLRKAIEDIKSGTEIEIPKEAPQRVLVRAGHQFRAIEIQKAAYFYTENKMVYYQGFDGPRQAVDEKLERLEEWLDATRFFRINRQFIVCIDAIEHMISYSKSRIKLNLKPAHSSDTIVSKERTPVFKKWLTGKT